MVPYDYHSDDQINHVPLNLINFAESVPVSPSFGAFDFLETMIFISEYVMSMKQIVANFKWVESTRPVHSLALSLFQLRE